LTGYKGLSKQVAELQLMIKEKTSHLCTFLLYFTDVVAASCQKKLLQYTQQWKKARSEYKELDRSQLRLSV
jgi:hypothetical protein